ncbi:MAG TPA: hypothetical protein VGA59_02880 [Ramlibacter sp.]|jgi:hypothetical protein
MGLFMKEHDVHVENLLGELNVRFGPTPNKKSHFGGIAEMAALQKEFKIFKKGRSFRTSVSVLNIGATNAEARNRLLDYFGNLSKHDSNVAGQNGDVAIVNAIVRNLSSKNPLPVYFTYHDMRAEKGNTRVLITDKSRPVPFFQQDYLTISVPTKAHATAKKTAKAAPKAPKA